MTTAHRPTFDPARGKEALRGPAYHQRLLPAHTQLKFRQPGQGGIADADRSGRDLAAELLAAEAGAKAGRRRAVLGGSGAIDADDDGDAAYDDGEDGENGSRRGSGLKRGLLKNGDGDADGGVGDGDDDHEAKRRRVLLETREMDADDSDDEDGGGMDGEEANGGKDRQNGDDGDDDEDEDDEDAELQRELERVRREREERKKQQEAQQAQEEQDARERAIATGNPLLNKQDFTMKRRWDDDVVFKNQARGTEERERKKEFVNIFTDGLWANMSGDGDMIAVAAETFVSGLLRFD